MTDKNLSPARRNLLKGVAGASALPFVGAFMALQSQQARAANGATALIDSPYGPIRPIADMTTGLPLLQLPPGFTYKSFGWRGDTMANGVPCPGSHDGMGVVVSRKVGRSTELVLVRNHEVGATSAGNFINAPGVYDNGNSTTTSSNKFGGGTTNLIFRDGNWVSMTPSLGGTQTNCAGGITPWGTWLSCEEVSSDAVSASGRKHGYVFEVHADPALTTGLPIIGMGRFGHEAAAVDPASGNVYQTEDSSGKSGFYRYVPDIKNGAPGSLAMGGVLQMAKVKGVPNVNLAHGAAECPLRTRMGAGGQSGPGPRQCDRSDRHRHHERRRSFRAGLDAGRAAHEPRRGHLVCAGQDVHHGYVGRRGAARVDLGTGPGDPGDGLHLLEPEPAGRQHGRQPDGQPAQRDPDLRGCVDRGHRPVRLRPAPDGHHGAGRCLHLRQEQRQC